VLLDILVRVISSDCHEYSYSRMSFISTKIVFAIKAITQKISELSQNELLNFHNRNNRLNSGTLSKQHQCRKTKSSPEYVQAQIMD